MVAWLPSIPITKGFNSAVTQGKLATILMHALSRPLAICTALALGLPAPSYAQDADGDGVPDVVDLLPCDASASALVHAPAEGHFMMVAWEDMWPARGDLDFNDLVLGVHYLFRLQGAEVSSIRLTLTVLAVGGSLDNGVGLQLPLSRGAVQRITRTVNGAGAVTLVPEEDAALTFTISGNVRELFGGQQGPINSTGPALAAPTVEVEIELHQPVLLPTGEAPFDLYLFRAANPGHQIHRPIYAGTSRMDASLFGSSDDGSSPTRRFVDSAGLPFALVFPQIVPYPRESVEIAQLYPNIVGFAASAGETHRDFYTSQVVPSQAYAAAATTALVLPQADRSCLGVTPRAFDGTSCHTLYLASGGAAPSGSYTIDPDGPAVGLDPFQVWCEMRSDGGWEVLHHGPHSIARTAVGTPSGAPGWAMDYLSGPLRHARVDAFSFEVIGGPSRTFHDVTRFGTSQRPTLDDLFSGNHRQTWECNSDAPSASVCHFSTGDGRHWGLWEHPSSCCLGASTGGFWFYSRSAQGTQNYGACGDGYPLGAAYSGAASGCSGAGFFTPVSPTGSAVIRIAVRLYVPPAADGETCRTILERGESRGDGLYWIDPDGPLGAEPIAVWCDMTTEGGGWIVVHDDTHAHARRPRGTPSAASGWNVDFLTAHSPLRWMELEDFRFEIPGVYAKTFRDVAGYGGERRLTPPDIFGGTHALTWSCNTDAPSSSACWFTTGDDGRHWGLWESTSGCCIGNNTGGFWFYSRSVAGTENYGVCGNGYPLGAAYTGAASGCSGSGYFTPVSPADSQRFRVLLREPSRPAALNARAAARASCREILNAGESAGSGLYWLEREGRAYQAHCDMETDGGGWTTFFAGRNGSPNVFDHLDASAFRGICTDPSRRCARRVPSSVPQSGAELAVVFASSAVKMPLEGALRAYAVSGAQAGWVNVVSEDLGTGPVFAGPSTLWTGSGTNYGWIAARSQSSSWVFASSYNTSTSWNGGNRTTDTTTPIRLMYREGGRPPEGALNQAAAARGTCRQILDAGEAAGSGLYWLTQGGAPYLAHCDMVTDGGGWTTFFAGYNGSPNVVDHLDIGHHGGSCTDPQRRCVRRMPAAVPQAGTELAVVVGDGVAAAPFTPALYGWATAGTQASWVTMTGERLAGTVNVVPDTMWTGNGTNRSWIAARGSSSAQVFAASYRENTTWDSANGQANTWSPIRLMFREGGPPVHPEARVSCRAHRAAGASASAVYTLQQPGGRAYAAYCDMTTDGGGWTAVFAGRNGSPHVFDAFDAGYHVGVCTDPAARCLRRAPALDVGSTQLLASCGAAAVRFDLSAQLYNWLRSGTQASWAPLSNAVSVGSAPVANVPNNLWTGSGTNRSFVISRGTSASAATTFASSYNQNASWDYCNGVADTTSPLRLYYREAP